jgi:membrane-associated phospholipid phosphatase
MKLSRGTLFPSDSKIAASKNNLNYDGTTYTSAVAFKYSFLRALHRLFMPLATGPTSNQIVADVQGLCGLQLDGTASNKVVHALFTLSSTAGEEIYSLMPALLWVCIDVGIPFTTNFGLMLTFGQLTKDWLALPRPPATWKGCRRPIVKLEKHFETEYGFPSTHTMSGLMPLVVALALTRRGYDVGDNCFMSCAIYLLCVALSRLYMGVHSVLDIVGGLAIGLVWVFLLHAVGDSFDYWMYQHPLGIVWILLTLIPFLTCYPKTAPWSASYGTSCQFYGTWFGCALSFWYIDVWNPHAGEILRSISILRIGPESYWLTCKQVAVGMVMVAINKVAVKYLATKFFLKLRRLGLLTGVPEEEVDAYGTKIPETKTYCIEVPVR